MKKLLVVFPLVFLLVGCQLTPYGEPDLPPTAGIYKTTNNGEDWEYLSNPERGQPISNMSVFSLRSDPMVPSVLYAGVFSTGIYRSWDAGQTWDSINRGIPAIQYAFINQITFDPNDTNTLYVVGRFDEIGKIVWGDNAGANWEYLYADALTTTDINSFTISHVNHRLFYATSRTKAFLRSEDKGQTWQAMHWFDGIPGKVITLPQNDNLIFVGVEGKGVMKSEDGGANWQVCTQEIEDERRGTRIINLPKVNDLAHNPLRPLSVYAITQSGIFFNSDGGDSWDSISDSLPLQRQDIRTIAFHPQDLDTFYIGAKDTLYITYNHGYSWDIKKLYIPDEIRHIVVDQRDPATIYLGVGVYED
ncbi:MAG TPA: hypothetical protein ENN77_01400 [Candidatus Wirthbacteria bacterium]|nr:hypothetical protein [Candidatus Wirthbacteria bacterium]